MRLEGRSAVLGDGAGLALEALGAALEPAPDSAAARRVEERVLFRSREAEGPAFERVTEDGPVLVGADAAASAAA